MHQGIITTDVILDDILDFETPQSTTMAGTKGEPIFANGAELSMARYADRPK